MNERNRCNLKHNHPATRRLSDSGSNAQTRWSEEVRVWLLWGAEGSQRWQRYSAVRMGSGRLHVSPPERTRLFNCYWYLVTAHINVSLTSPSRPQPEACVGFFARTGEFLLEISRVSWGFWLLSDEGGGCNVSHTHTHTQYSKRNGEWGRKNGGGGRHRTDFDTFLASGSKNSVSHFLSLLSSSSSSYSLLFVVSRAILSKQEQPHLWSNLSGFD